MSRVDPQEPVAQARPTEPDSTATFPADREGEDGMGLRSVTVERFEEIRRRLGDGRGIREIARAFPGRAPAPAHSNYSPAAQSAASTSTWRSSRSASTAAPRAKTRKITQFASRSISSRRPLSTHRERFSTIVNTFPRIPPKCSRSRGIVFTLSWIGRSPSRGNRVHDRVEYAAKPTLLTVRNR
jgi:hypothetical protein